MIRLKYSDSSTYDLSVADLQLGLSQDLPSWHIPYSNQVGATRLGLGMAKITAKGTVTASTALAARNVAKWHDVVAVSLDSGTTWQTVYFSDVTFADDQWSPLVPYSLNILASPVREGAVVRYPSSGYQWGDSSIANISQAGNVPAYATLYYLGPQAYWPLTNDLVDFAGLGITFTRTAAKSHGGITYAINKPAFDVGLYLGSDTSTDVGKVTLPTTTLKTVAMQIKHTRTDGLEGTALTIWTSAHNSLTINTSTNVLSWTDGTTTVTVTFPTAAWNAGTVIDVVAIEAASHAVTLAVHAAGGSWATGTGTLALVTWPELTLGPLEGSLANVILFDYALTSTEYQAMDYSLAPLRLDNLFVTNKYAGTITKTSDRRLLTAAGVDVSGLVSGADSPITSTPRTMAMTAGLSARWYLEVKRTDTP